MRTKLLVAMFAAILVTNACSGGGTSPSPTNPTPTPTPTPSPSGPPPATGPLPGTEPVPVPIPGGGTLMFWVSAFDPNVGGTFVDSVTRGNITWACTAPNMVKSFYMHVNFADGVDMPGFGNLVNGGSSTSSGLCNGFPKGTGGMISGTNRRSIRELRIEIWLNKQAPEGDPDGLIYEEVNWVPQS